jgi:hypothetical protein
MLRCALNDLVQRFRWRFQDADRLYHEGINAESRGPRVGICRWPSSFLVYASRERYFRINDDGL